MQAMTSARYAINVNDPRCKEPIRYLREDYSAMIACNSFTWGYYFGLRHSTIKLDRLITRTLSKSLSVILEPDADGFIARTPDLPIYGFGDDKLEAIENLKYEIESLYNDLMEDDNFTDEWLTIKEFLKKIVTTD